MPHQSTALLINDDTLESGVQNARFKVLLVEDYEANVMVATVLLENFGVAYDVASTGEEALQKIAANSYDMVLMDLQMPGMDGFQATAMLRERERTRSAKTRLPIVGMTAHALKGDRERCIEAGMDDYIAKPFRPETLKAALDKYRQLAEALTN